WRRGRPALDRSQQAGGDRAGVDGTLQVTRHDDEPSVLVVILEGGEFHRSFQCTRGSPATGERKLGKVVPRRLPRYTVRQSGPPKVRLAIHGASVPAHAPMISGVRV